MGGLGGGEEASLSSFIIHCLEALIVSVACEGGFFFARIGTPRYVVFGLTGARSHGFVNMDHDQYRHRAEVARGGCGEKRRRRGSAKA